MRIRSFFSIEGPVTSFYSICALIFLFFLSSFSAPVPPLLLCHLNLAFLCLFLSPPNGTSGSRRFLLKTLSYLSTNRSAGVALTLIFLRLPVSSSSVQNSVFLILYLILPIYFGFVTIPVSSQHLFSSSISCLFFAILSSISFFLSSYSFNS